MTEPKAPPASGEPDVATELDPAADEAQDLEPAASVHLLVRLGGTTRVLDLADGADLVVGRTADNALQVDDSRVSRRHARFERRGTALTVTDLDSRNGIRVNGRLVRGGSRTLGGGELVQVGPAELVVAVAAGRDLQDAGKDPPKPPEGADPLDLEDAEGVVVADDAMVKVFKVARRLAQAPSNVLILGETGVGKEVVAERIHAWSPRARGPFVRLNCASLPEGLLESELFGHEKGAFTGADRRKVGYFEAAHGGTLFLDETGELSLATQAKLLRVLESRRLARLGATQETPIDVRVICATHRDLQRAVGDGSFREDLYYRISTFSLHVPPLRERPAEIALLAELFGRDICRRMGAAPAEISAAAMSMLGTHRWPGNVRELRNAIEHAVVLADDGKVLPEHLPASVRGLPSGSGAGAESRAMRDDLAELERRRIEAALAAHGGNRTRAARELGISRRALIYKLAKHGLS